MTEERDLPERLRPSPGVTPRDTPGSGGGGWPATDQPVARPEPGGPGWTSPAGRPTVAAPGPGGASGPATGHPPAGSASPTGPRPSPSVSSPGPTTTSALRRGPRRARLTVKRVDPWSVLKVTFVFSLAMLIVGVVAVIVLYVILGGMGVFDSISSFLQDVSPGSHTVRDYAPLSKVVGGAVVIGIVNVVLVTALSTLGAFIYNLCADLVGGVEVTLTERE